jgi:multicomponent Na+:H+ antiporter subunit B
MHIINGILHLDYIVLLLLVISALAVVRSRNLLASTLFLTIFSLLMALQYLILGAPDVAITEAAVGAGISTIILLLALFHVGDVEKTVHSPWLPLLIVCIVGALLIYVTVDMPAFGNAYAPANLHLAPYYLHVSPDDIGIPNVVTSILASYRGFDTFGETVVIFTAGVAVLLLLKDSGKGRK